MQSNATTNKIWQQQRRLGFTSNLSSSIQPIRTCICVLSDITTMTMHRDYVRDFVDHTSFPLASCSFLFILSPLVLYPTCRIAYTWSKMFKCVFAGLFGLLQKGAKASLLCTVQHTVFNSKHPAIYSAPCPGVHPAHLINWWQCTDVKAITSGHNGVYRTSWYPLY